MLEDVQNRQVKVVLVKEKIPRSTAYKIAKRKQTTPVSERKVKCIYKQKMTGHVEGYRLIDMGILQCLVSSLACPECHEKALVLEEDGCKKKGIPYFITVLCTEGDYKFGSYTSKTVQPLVEGSNCTKPFEVNISNVSAFRSCGVGDILVWRNFVV